MWTNDPVVTSLKSQQVDVTSPRKDSQQILKMLLVEPEFFSIPQSVHTMVLNLDKRQNIKENKLRFNYTRYKIWNKRLPGA